MNVARCSMKLKTVRKTIDLKRVLKHFLWKRMAVAILFYATKKDEVGERYPKKHFKTLLKTCFKLLRNNTNYSNFSLYK